MHSFNLTILFVICHQLAPKCVRIVCSFANVSASLVWFRSLSVFIIFVAFCCRSWTRLEIHLPKKGGQKVKKKKKMKTFGKVSTCFFSTFRILYLLAKRNINTPWKTACSTGNGNECDNESGRHWNMREWRLPLEHQHQDSNYSQSVSFNFDRPSIARHKFELCLNLVKQFTNKLEQMWKNLPPSDENVDLV